MLIKTYLTTLNERNHDPQQSQQTVQRNEQGLVPIPLAKRQSTPGHTDQGSACRRFAGIHCPQSGVTFI